MATNMETVEEVVFQNSELTKRYTMYVPTSMKIHSNHGISAALFSYLDKTFDVDETGSKKLILAQSLQVLSDLGLLQTWSAMAKGSGVSLGKQAEFDQLSQAAYSREVDDETLYTLGAVAPSHLTNKEKVRFMEIAVASIPKGTESTAVPVMETETLPIIKKLRTSEAPRASSTEVRESSRSSSTSPVPRAFLRSPVSRSSSTSSVPRSSLKTPVSRSSSMSPVVRVSSTSPVPRSILESPVSRSFSTSPVPTVSLLTPVPRSFLESPVPSASLTIPVPRSSTMSPVLTASLTSSVPRASTSSPAPQATASPEDDSQPGTETDNKLYWSHEAVLLLIDLRQRLQHLFSSSTVSMKQAWRTVADEMGEKGFNFTGPECDKKFRSMKSRHRTIVERNKTTGRGRSTWRYFSIMDELTHGDPAVEPVVSVSSLQGSQTEVDDVVPEAQEQEQPTPTSRRRRSSSSETLESALTALRRDLLTMHRERMELETRRVVALESIAQSLKEKHK